MARIKRIEEIDIIGFYNRVWSLIDRCNATEFEILGALSKIEKEFERLCEISWIEENKRLAEEEFKEEEEKETRKIKKLDPVMYR